MIMVMEMMVGSRVVVSYYINTLFGGHALMVQVINVLVTTYLEDIYSNKGFSSLV